MFPIFRSIPDRVVGMPVFRAMLFFIPEMPSARFQLKLNPYFLPIIFIF